MAETKPPIPVTLEWQGDHRFQASTPRAAFVLDGDGVAGPSPMQAVAAALAGCMAIDVVHILTKGRATIDRVTASLTARRSAEAPAPFVGMTLHFTIVGDAPGEHVTRAIDLSREKYCSVWHSLRQDIAFDTTFTIVAPERGSGR
ncbi:MAG: OsmC family protein [Vicinamibacterales bacterium]